jgi:hypothetical protein
MSHGRDVVPHGVDPAQSPARQQSHAKNFLLHSEDRVQHAQNVVQHTEAWMQHRQAARVHNAACTPHAANLVRYVGSWNMHVRVGTPCPGNPKPRFPTLRKRLSPSEPRYPSFEPWCSPSEPWQDGRNMGAFSTRERKRPPQPHAASTPPRSASLLAHTPAGIVDEDVRMSRFEVEGEGFMAQIVLLVTGGHDPDDRDDLRLDWNPFSGYFAAVSLLPPGEGTI